MPFRSNLEARARRVARTAGFVARKSRRAHDADGFMLVNADNCLVAGEHFELTAEDVIALCLKSRASTFGGTAPT